MAKESPILVRLFKEEAELEVWKQDRTGRYALLKTYPICRWSGDLGPKIKEGDRQAPEGFYAITPGLMNPNSQYYLAFNLGYPNAFDRAHDRTGAHLMVHGDCSSRGCYAMTDEQISEIFAMGRESFFAGQSVVPGSGLSVPDERRRTWRSTATRRISPSGKCSSRATTISKSRAWSRRSTCASAAMSSMRRRIPRNSIRRANARPSKCRRTSPNAVNDKQRRDELQIAELTARNVPTAPITSNRDGGMHPKFVAALKPQEMVDEKGKIRLIVENPKPGKLASVAYSPTDRVRHSRRRHRSSRSRRSSPTCRCRARAPQKQDGAKPEEPSFAQKMENFFRPAPKAAPEPRVAAAGCRQPSLHSREE